MTETVHSRPKKNPQKPLPNSPLLKPKPRLSSNHKMFFFKTRSLTNPTVHHSLQIAIFSSSPTQTLSSFFANPPSEASQFTKPSQNQNLQNKGKNFVVPKSTNKQMEEKDSTKDLSKNQKMQNKDRNSVPRPKNMRMEEKEFPKELSAEATMLVSRLVGDGYLKDANFTKGRDLEPQEIPANFYSRHFLKTAAERFGRDHQEVAKWLSGGDLKKIALFGCPSIERKSVFAAKRLRAFFRIQEDVACRGCKLKNSCKFANQRVGTMDKVILEDVMRLVTVYILDSISPQLVIPDELSCSVVKLVKEAVSLTDSSRQA